jgi:hypothetical protein
MSQRYRVAPMRSTLAPAMHTANRGRRGHGPAIEVVLAFASSGTWESIDVNKPDEAEVAEVSLSTLRQAQGERN